MSVRQYVVSDPPIIKFRQHIKDTNGIPSIVWQQQMEKAHIKTYKTAHVDRRDRYYEKDYTKDFETQFRPLQIIEDYNPQNIDPEYGKDSYWDDDLYDRQSLQFRHDDYSSTDDEEDPEITATKLSRALIELWQTNTEALHQKIAEECLNQQTHETEPSLLDEAAVLNILVIKEGEPAYIPLSTNLGLKFKRRMLYFPMDSNRITEN